MIVSATKRSMALSMLLGTGVLCYWGVFSLVGDSLSVSKSAMNQAVFRVSNGPSSIARRFIYFPRVRQASSVKASFCNIAGKKLIYCLSRKYWPRKVLNILQVLHNDLKCVAGM